jgi:hypothetical protein
MTAVVSVVGGGGRLWLALGGWVYGTVLPRGLPGQFVRWAIILCRFVGTSETRGAIIILLQMRELRDLIPL